MSRQEFSKPNKRLLAERVGYRCSNPACGVATIGPSNAPNNSDYVGVAAHIYAAAIDKGPRAKPDLTEQERRSLNNGIHLCEKCATKIDEHNGVGYPPEVLLGWKRCAEAAAQERIYQNRPYILFAEVDFSNLEKRYSTALTCTGLNEKNVLSCPSDENIILEVINKLRLANKCVLAGSSGSGKSLLTFQVAYHFHQKGWTVFKTNKEWISNGTVLAAPTTKSLVIIDDAQTLETRHLENLLGSAHTGCIVLANSNTSALSGDDISRKFPTIEIVRSAQVNMLEQFCMENRHELAETLRGIGLSVKSNDIHNCIEVRIKRAAREATPWLFNYSLTESWRVAQSDFYMLRDDKDLHMVLVAVAIFQFATLDLGVSDHVVTSALRKYKDDDEWLDRALNVLRDRCQTAEGNVRNKHYEYSRKILARFISESGLTQGSGYLITLIRDILTSTVYERGHSNIIEFVMFEFPQCKHQLNNEGFTKQLAEDLIHDNTTLTPSNINKLNSLIRMNPVVISVLKSRDNLVEDWILTSSKDTAYQLGKLLNTLINEDFGSLNGGDSLFDHLLNLIMSADPEDRPRCSYLINRMHYLLRNHDEYYASEKLGESEFSVDLPKFGTGMACRHFSEVVNNFCIINQSWADRQIADNVETLANLFNSDFLNALKDFGELLGSYFGVIGAILGNYSAPTSVKKNSRELIRRIEISAIVRSLEDAHAVQMHRYGEFAILVALHNKQKLRAISDKFNYARLEFLFSDFLEVDHYHRGLVAILRNPDSPNWRRHAAWVIKSVDYVESLFLVWDEQLSLQRLRDGIRYEIRIHMCSDCEFELAILNHIFEKESKSIFRRIVGDNKESLTKAICTTSLNGDDHRSKYDLLLFLISNSQFILREIFAKEETSKVVVDKLERLLRGKKWEKMIGRLYFSLLKEYGATNYEQISAMESRFSSLRDFNTAQPETIAQALFPEPPKKAVRDPTRIKKTAGDKLKEKRR